MNAAALLADVPNDFIRNRPLDQQPYWHIERARIGDSSLVPVELIVNGQVVERREIEADGDMEDLVFEWTPERSEGWVAVRIFPSCHTNPIFVKSMTNRFARWPSQRAVVFGCGRCLLGTKAKANPRFRDPSRGSRVRGGS
ncbi:MAG: hypothetical protein R3B96_23520 [Pirellulaceae bacterium]